MHADTDRQTTDRQTDRQREIPQLQKKKKTQKRKRKEHTLAVVYSSSALNIHKHTTITLWPTIHTNDEYFKKCSPQGPTREHTQPGYCFCGLMFSLGHSEEVCLQRKESPLQLLSGLPAGNHGFPHRCPSGGGLSEVTNKSFQSSLPHQSVLSAWEKSYNQQWPLISTHPDL